MIKINKENVISADLLSVEEASKLPKWVLANGDWCWLQSPGDDSRLAATVNNDGSVGEDGDYVNYGNNAVRPALEIKNLESKNLEIGDLVEVLGRKAQYIGGNKVLLCEPIFFSRFDSESNEYETSEVKKKLDEWFRGMLKRR